MLRLRKYCHYGISIGPVVIRHCRKFSINIMRSDAPGKLSAFTGKADFYESLYFLEDIYQKVRPLSAIIHQDSLASTEKPTVAAPVAWLNQSKMSDHLGFGLSLLQYRKVVAKLTQLVPYAAELPELMQFMQGFIQAPIRFTRTDSTRNIERFIKPIP